MFKKFEKINDLSINLRLNLLIGSAIVIIFSIMGAYIYHVQRTKISEDADSQMKEQVGDLCKLVELQIKERQIQVNSSIDCAAMYLKFSGKLSVNNKNRNELEIKNQITQEAKKVSIPSIYLGVHPLFNDTNIVNDISKITHVKTTFFQKINEGYLRIATTVKKADGSRAVGTYIPNESPVAKAIDDGKDYNGRAFVVNDWYLTTYHPVKIDNTIIGMLFAGTPEKDLNELKQIFNKKIFFKSGYPFIVSKDGKYIIHPKMDNADHKNDDFFKKIVESKSDKEKSFYLEEGEQKIQFFKYLPEIEAYVVVSIHEDELMESANFLRNILIICIIISIIILITINTYISHTLSQSINKGVAFAQKISDGNLTVQLEIYQKDEIGVLASSLTKMIERIREVIKTVVTSSENFVASSHELSSSAQQISSGANEQAAASEEISSSIEEIHGSINQTSENALETEKIATHAVESIKMANDSVTRTTDAMRIIIQKISIIKEIAEKTDLLAVNAAIESARAGEYGKGFAVVASEVRKLAERSQKAAKEIDDISISSVLIAEESGKMLAEVIPQIQNTARLVQEISTTSMEQNSGITQISQAIQQLSTVTQANSALSEELASSSEEVTAQATLLLDTISYFKISQKEVDEQSDIELENEIRKLTQMLVARKGQEAMAKTNYRAEKHERSNTQKPESISKKKGITLDFEDKLDHGYDKY